MVIFSFCFFQTVSCPLESIVRLDPICSFSALSSAVEVFPFLLHKFIEFMEVDVRKDWREYTSYKVANLPIEFSRTIPRAQLRPGYGDGFRGAPLEDRGIE